jgi:hypothetical protein
MRDHCCRVFELWRGRLEGSNVWVEYDRISNHKKLLGNNANFEEFDVSSSDNKLR